MVAWPGVTITREFDRTADVRKAVRALLKTRVLVGVTEDSAIQGVSQGQINNAVKAYLNDNGAPEVNIPQRQFMRPGVEAQQAAIEGFLVDAAVAKFTNSERDFDIALTLAGSTARDGIVNEIDSGPLPSAGRTLSPKTLELRKSGRFGTRPKSDSELPLAESGSLRQSITWEIDS